MNLKMPDEHQILNDMLLGQFVSRFSLGDTWDFFINEYWLSAHTIIFEEESEITNYLKSNYDYFNDTVDKEDIAKSAIMAANLRKRITKIELDKMKNLTIDFENCSTLKILTNTEIVDWQWCINKSGKDPYRDSEIACFWAGKIETKK